MRVRMRQYESKDLMTTNKREKKGDERRATCGHVISDVDQVSRQRLNGVLASLQFL